jgi:N-6 DNA Methylase
MDNNQLKTALYEHQKWIGLLQPTGLVVTSRALIHAQAFLDMSNQSSKNSYVCFCELFSTNDPREIRPEFNPAASALHFLTNCLGWNERDLIAKNNYLKWDENYAVQLPEYQETLEPFLVAVNKEHRPLIYVGVVPLKAYLDDASTGHLWTASPHTKFERLLREKNISTGILISSSALRLVYAPKGEATGYIDFPFRLMTTTSGRSAFSAMHLLLNSRRIWSLPTSQKLLDILQESRKYQNEVSIKLARQVLSSLYALSRGFSSLAVHSNSLQHLAKNNPDHIYQGLLTVLLRVIFVLYAEDRGLFPRSELYAKNYGMLQLFEKLRQDAAAHPDTMHERFGSWSRFVSLSRLLHAGCTHSDMRLIPRSGYLFDPAKYPFLEGHFDSENFGRNGSFQLPRIPDSVFLELLTNLLIVDGERISYRTLDVEQIGSVYETIMGFEVFVAETNVLALRDPKTHGGLFFDFDTFKNLTPTKRSEWLENKTGEKLTPSLKKALQNATIESELIAALESRISAEASPQLMPKGSLCLQPTEERRRTGSHYTPRSLTEPIVRKTLEPLLANLGSKPKPEQILELKVCDPAMGSGAFLVEVCRQLADALLISWQKHKKMPNIPKDEDEVLFARRTVARHCLYGVDKNPLAVDLAKLSLWLVTFAKEHEFTFVDHALRHGDSLVGLDKNQILSLHWDTSNPNEFIKSEMIGNLKEALDLRSEVQNADENATVEELSHKLKLANDTLAELKLFGNAVVSGWFLNPESNGKKSKEWLAAHFNEVEANARNLDTGAVHTSVLKMNANLNSIGIYPFHWELEFPEVFGRKNPGFDSIVGNPPFAGKNTITSANPKNFLEWLKVLHSEAHGNSDLVAHFFRRAFSLVRNNGAFGLIATNTIAQGDTRSTGLRYICENGGVIYNAQKRLKWPGLAAVIVSVVHVFKGKYAGRKSLDGRVLDKITAFLFHDGGNQDPAVLKANANKSFQGSIVLGMGFTFDDSNHDATSIAEMHRLVEQEPRNQERIFPYIGGEEINSSPTHAHHRYVINFGEMSENEARGWPDLMTIIEEKVRPLRLNDNRATYRKFWWHFAEKRRTLYDSVAPLERILVNAKTSNTKAFTFVSGNFVFDQSLNVFAFSEFLQFALLSSNLHFVWANFLGSSMKDDIRYNVSDCFETFPFPQNWETDSKLEAAGKTYYEFRAALMLRNNEGLTTTYNRFHDRNEQDPEILKLRQLHAKMDRSVLDAYGWQDLEPTCDFYLDYEDDPETENEQPKAKGKQKKKPWRYRWAPEIHDEVLARLLKLNSERAAEEKLQGQAQGKKTIKKKAKGGNDGDEENALW